MGLKEVESKHLAKLRAKLQRLSQLLYRQWSLRFQAFGKGEAPLDRAAVHAGEETTQFIRDLRAEFGWIPFQIISRDVVVVQHLGIRCEPTRTVPANLQPARPTVAPRPFVGRIGWTGATKPGQYVPSARVPVSTLSSRGTGRGVGTSVRGMGLWRRSGPLPSARPLSAPYSAMSRQNSVRGRGQWRRPGPLPSARPPSAPSSSMSRQNSVRGRGQLRRPTVPTPYTTEPGQYVARGGRFFE